MVLPMFINFQERSLESKLASLQHKIQIEDKCREGAENMLGQLSDKNARQQCLITISESKKRMEFLVNEHQKLQALTGGGPLSKDSSASIHSTSQEILHDKRSSTHGEDSKTLSKRLSEPVFHKETFEAATQSPTFSKSLVSMNSKSSSSVFSVILSTLGIKSSKSKPTEKQSAQLFGPMDGKPISFGMTPRKHMDAYQTDFWKSDTPITVDKVNFKISEITSRLQTEEKVQTGMESMLAESPHPAKEQVLAKLQDCRTRVMLLNKSLLKIRGLQIDDPSNASPEVSTQSDGNYSS